MELSPGTALGTLLLSLTIVFGTGSAAKAADASIQVIVGQDGSAECWLGKQSLGRITPIVFTKGWNSCQFGLDGPYPATHWAANLPDGAKIALTATVDVLPQGLHFKVRMTPSRDTQALAARMAWDAPYGLWQGQPYQWKGGGGFVPVSKSANVVIAETQAPWVTLGPSGVLDGLTMALSSTALSTQLADSRAWGGNLTVILSHGEKDSPWDWSKGETKAFDFTVSFNRPVVQVHGQALQRPFPYRELPVTFEDAPAGVTLSGTLSLPPGPGPFPVAEMIIGSGPNPRDGYGGGGYFLVISDDLVRHGIATLRYDKRGTGESTGRFQGAGNQDFADDAAAGLAFLKTRPEIDPSKIGLIGHSEGGRVAPLAAARTQAAAFVVILSGPGQRGLELLEGRWDRADAALPADLRGARHRMRRKALDAELQWTGGSGWREQAHAAVQEELGPLSKAYPTAVADGEAFWKDNFAGFTVDAASHFYLAYDPKDSLKALKCPVLALAGGLDDSYYPDEQVPGIKAGLKAGKNPDATVKILPGLDHSLNSNVPGQAIDPGALALMRDWIVSHTR
jgi:pimeloyl-ACP methyl ester carboxylesterase